MTVTDLCVNSLAFATSDFSIEENCVTVHVYLKDGSFREVSLDCTDYPTISAFFGDDISQYENGLLAAWPKFEQGSFAFPSSKLLRGPMSLVVSMPLESGAQVLR